MLRNIDSPEAAVTAYREYLELEYEALPEEEIGFIQEPQGWVLFSRSGRGYVNPLYHPQSLAELLEVVLPGASLSSAVEVLARELKEARARLASRNRQIRDLRRQARK